MTAHAKLPSTQATEPPGRAALSNEKSSGAQHVDSRSEFVSQRKIQHLANSSPQVRQLIQLQAMADAEPVGKAVQFKKKKNGIEWAENQNEASTLMSAYAERLGLDWSTLPANLKELAIAHAQDKTKGIDSAERLLLGEKQSIVDANKKQERAERVSEDFGEIVDTIADPLAQAAFRVAHSTYIGGGSVNTGLSAAYTNDAYEEAKTEWDDIQSSETIRNFRSHWPQDKEKLGKGNVADTLDKRKIQGNLFCTFHNTEINVHVTIED